MQLGCADLTSTVGNPESIEVQARQVVGGGNELIVTGRAKVGPADNGMNTGGPQFTA